ncbi:MAG: DUF7691 family protein [Flavisolibacter sp.]
MGIRVIPIAVDIDSVKKVFGSKDEDLFNRVISSRFYKEFDKELSFKNELMDIIFNYVPPEQRMVKLPKLFGLIRGDTGRGMEGEWYDYGYALLTICCMLGYRLGDDGFVFLHNDSDLQTINSLLKKIGCKHDLTRMFETQPIFDTPFEASDIYTNLYSKKEVAELCTHFLSIENNIGMHNLQLFDALKTGLLYCLDNNLDLVIYSYEL